MWRKDFWFGKNGLSKVAHRKFIERPEKYMWFKLIFILNFLTVKEVYAFLKLSNSSEG